MTDPATYINGRTVQEQMNSLIGYVDQRSAEVAVDAIAADVAQVAADKADAHADALAAAASAAAAAGTLANAVTLTDAQTITGAKTFSVSPVVPTPTNNTDASTKKYVDDADASILAAINSLDAAVVKLTGNQTVGGTKTFSASPVGPTEATGTFSTKLATSDKVKNEMDAYSPMLRTTGNQTFTGVKRGSGTGVYHKMSTLSTAAEPPSGSTTEEILSLESTNAGNIVQMFNSETKDAQCILNISTKHIFKDDDDSIKSTQAGLWIVAYKDKAILFLRGTDKNGTSTSQVVATLNF